MTPGKLPNMGLVQRIPREIRQISNDNYCGDVNIQSRGYDALAHLVTPLAT